MDELEEWISTEAAGDLSGFSRAYLRRLIKAGRILARKVARDWLINRESLLDYKRRMDALGPQKFNWRRSRRPGPGPA